MNSSSLLLCVLGLLCVFTSVVTASHKYQPGESVPVWVDRAGPINNAREFYRYYQLPFCRPEQVPGQYEGLGESLLGYELRRSPIQINFGVPTKSGTLCTLSMKEEEAYIFDYTIQRQYWYQFFIDDLPVWGMIGESVKAADGSTDSYIYSHLHFDISKNINNILEVNLTAENAVKVEAGVEITFTYSVNWIFSAIPYSQRFNKYLDVAFFEHQIHWFSFFNSVMVSLFLVGLLVMIVMRTIKKEYVPLGEEEEDGLSDESGWKMVHREVFRPPTRLGLFSALLGSGAHLLFAILVVLILGVMGANYYQSRGSILTGFIMWDTLFASFIGGYYSGSVYARNRGDHWIRTAINTTLLFPIVFLLITMASSIIARSYVSLAYIPFFAYIFLGLLVVVSFILVVAGAIFGRQFGGNQNQISGYAPHGRMIPSRPWYQQGWVLSLCGGVLPFASIFIELYYMFAALWHYKFYYVYGYALTSFAFLLVITAGVNVVCTYFLLNSEDHRWQWRSFNTGASVGLYVFLYSLYYYSQRTLMSGFLQFTQYVAFSLLLSIIVSLICGTTGYFASYRFVKRIYRDIKVE